MTEKASNNWRLVTLFAVLHLLCCGIPLLILSGVSLGFILPQWPVLAVVLALVGIVGFIWYLKRGCPTCPRNEGRCSLKQRPAIERNTTDPGNSTHE